MRRYYEATYVDEHTGTGATFLSIPWEFAGARTVYSGREAGQFINIHDAASTLGVRNAEILSDEYLVRAMTLALLVPTTAQLETGGVRTSLLTLLRSVSQYPDYGPMNAFAHQLAWGPYAPAENSPFSGQQLGAMVGQLGGASTAIGVSTVLDMHPLLAVVACSFGIVAFGAAQGLSGGLRRGLDAWVYNKITTGLPGPDREHEES
jgi:hypothetical protein